MAEVAEQKYRREIDLGDGSGVQVFEADTLEGLVDKLSAAQSHATRKIRELNQEVKKYRKPDEPEKPVEFKPRTLTTDEQFQVQQDLQDPTKAGEAIIRVIEAKAGVPLEEIVKPLSAAEIDLQKQQAAEAATEFMRVTPEYIANETNKLALIGYMIEHRIAPISVNNFQIAFEEMKEAGLLELKSSETAPALPPKKELESEGIPQARPRGATSSSLRPRGSQPQPSARPPKFTKQQVLNMGPKEYKSHYDSDPEFRRIVDAMV